MNAARVFVTGLGRVIKLSKATVTLRLCPFRNAFAIDSCISAVSLKKFMRPFNSRSAAWFRGDLRRVAWPSPLFLADGAKNTETEQKFLRRRIGTINIAVQTEFSQCLDQIA